MYYKTSRLCTTKLAQSTSQYYFALQSLHEVLPSTTLYYKARTKYFPVLLTDCAKYFPAHIKFLLRNFYTEKLLHIEKLLHTENFAHGKFLHTERFAHSKLLHTEAKPMQRSCSQYNAFCSATSQTRKHGNHCAAIPLRSAATDSKTPYNYARMNIHKLQNTLEDPKNVRTSVPATASHTSCPSLPAAITLPEKNTLFRAPVSSPKSCPCNIHAAITRCVLQRHVTNPYVYMHMATKHGNNHAAIPLRSAATDSKTPYNYARMNATSLRHHFLPRSPLLVTSSLSHHFP